MLECCRLSIDKDLKFRWGRVRPNFRIWVSGHIFVIVECELLCYFSSVLCRLSHPNLPIPEHKWKKLPESLSIPTSYYSSAHLLCSRATDLALFSSTHWAILSTIGPLHSLPGIFPSFYTSLTLSHPSGSGLFATFFPHHPVQVPLPLPSSQQSVNLPTCFVYFPY